MSDLMFEWLSGLTLEELASPPMPGTKSPVDVWRSVDAHAGRLRGKLGLDPVSYATLRRDLGLAARATEDALAAMARQGAAITRGRAAELPAGDGQSGG